MPTPKNIPQVSYNTYFGNVGKIVWFSASENYNYFDLDFSITLQSFKKTNLQLYNNSTYSFVWSNIYPADVDQPQYEDYVRILNTPLTGVEQPFGILNLPT